MSIRPTQPSAVPLPSPANNNRLGYVLSVGHRAKPTGVYTNPQDPTQPKIIEIPFLILNSDNNLVSLEQFLGKFTFTLTLTNRMSKPCMTVLERDQYRVTLGEKLKFYNEESAKEGSTLPEVNSIWFAVPKPDDQTKMDYHEVGHVTDGDWKIDGVDLKSKLEQFWDHPNLVFVLWYDPRFAKQSQPEPGVAMDVDGEAAASDAAE